MPDIHLPSPAEAVPAPGWEPKRLAAPEDLARLLQPVRRRAVLPAVLLGRRGGRAR